VTFDRKSHNAICFKLLPKRLRLEIKASRRPLHITDGDDVRHLSAKNPNGHGTRYRLSASRRLPPTCVRIVDVMSGLKAPITTEQFVERFGESRFPDLKPSSVKANISILVGLQMLGSRREAGNERAYWLDMDGEQYQRWSKTGTVRNTLTHEGGSTLGGVGIVKSVTRR
jgi:hypothetical protein